ncbi:MAG TPA: outer membrane beta-barrel protein [Bryobacteraceae bacterium]|nr:outer membrane beta-barrel protein [Bryobacteraceae bacterium]
MFHKSLLMMLMAGAASIALPAYAQSAGPERQNVAVQAFGSFVTTTTENGIDNSATNSGGVLGTYRYFFSTHHGIEANYGYSRNTQNYDGAAAVSTNSHEVSGAYVFRMPFRKFTAFALAGAGALVFDPRHFAGASTQTRAAFVYGAGADLNLSQHIFLRAEYRGFVYNSPTYDVPGLAGLDRVTHRAEPSVGFGYRF